MSINNSKNLKSQTKFSSIENLTQDEISTINEVYKWLAFETGKVSVEEIDKISNIYQALALQEKNVQLSDALKIDSPGKWLAIKTHKISISQAEQLNDYQSKALIIQGINVDDALKIDTAEKLKAYIDKGAIPDSLFPLNEVFQSDQVVSSEVIGEKAIDMDNWWMFYDF